jgi:hypothetical protein
VFSCLPGAPGEREGFQTRASYCVAERGRGLIQDPLSVWNALGDWQPWSEGYGRSPCTIIGMLCVLGSVGIRISAFARQKSILSPPQIAPGRRLKSGVSLRKPQQKVRGLLSQSEVTRL